MREILQKQEKIIQYKIMIPRYLLKAYVNKDHLFHMKYNNHLTIPKSLI